MSYNAIQEDNHSTEDHMNQERPKLLKALPIIFNILILFELCVAMYFAAKQPDKLTEIFFSIFLTAFIITIVCTWITKYILHARTRRP